MQRDVNHYFALFSKPMWLLLFFRFCSVSFFFKLNNHFDSCVVSVCQMMKPLLYILIAVARSARCAESCVQWLNIRYSEARGCDATTRLLCNSEMTMQKKNPSGNSPPKRDSSISYIHADVVSYPWKHQPSMEPNWMCLACQIQCRYSQMALLLTINLWISARRWGVLDPKTYYLIATDWIIESLIPWHCIMYKII